jgi:hypothetical protein
MDVEMFEMEGNELEDVAVREMLGCSNLANSIRTFCPDNKP